MNIDGPLTVVFVVSTAITLVAFVIKFNQRRPL